jgi:hypothetical protein
MARGEFSESLAFVNPMRMSRTSSSLSSIHQDCGQIARRMEYGGDLNLCSFLVLPINDKVGTGGPEEHIAWGQVGLSVTAARPLRQMLEGAEELLDHLLGSNRIILGKIFLNVEKILQRQWGDLIGRHDRSLDAGAAQPGSGFFRADSFSLPQLLKAKINLCADFG